MVHNSPNSPIFSHSKILPRTVVASAHGEPHYISCKPSGQFVCSGICPRFTTYQICQHTVAAAEVSNSLNKFCQWWKKHCHTPDLESLAMSGLPKGVAGQKGGIAKRSRRGTTRSSTSTAPTRTHDRISCVTSIQCVTANSPSTVNFGYVHTQSTTAQSSVDNG